MKELYYDVISMSEAFSRVVIDRKLRDAKWDIESFQQVIFEDHGVAGRSDYILKNSSGQPLALIEAKAPEIDPYSAKQQALNYVDAQYKGKIQYIYLANDHVIYFWDITKGDAIQVNEFYTQRDLERKRNADTMGNVVPLTRNPITPDYLQRVDPSNFSLRHYQVEAINTIAEGYDAGKRAFLLEMATGTGKTGLAAALIRKFLETHQAQNVLFLVDRITLATQTKGAFEPILGDLSSIATFWGSARNNIVGANVVVATIQSMIKNGEDYFSPGYFDLIIHDEAHRSIYSAQARAATDRFYGATKVGLTATPKDFLKNIDESQLQIDDPRAFEKRLQRDTYKFFGCADGVATYRYTIQDGIGDSQGPFLVGPRFHKMNTVLTQKALSPEGLEVSEAKGESFTIRDLEKKVYLEKTNRTMMQEFLDNANKAPDGEIGKSIIFAVSQRHALKLEKILNEMMPAYGGQFAKTITSSVMNAQQIAKEFKDPENQRMRVAVSVDMLTTGFDCPEVLNIVLARPIFETTSYQQIKGRGTRLYTFHHDGKDFKKEFFTIFDFCGVVEYFEEKYDWEAPLKTPLILKGATVTGGRGEGVIGDGGTETPSPFTPIVSNDDDAVLTRDKMTVGPDGDAVDKNMYQSAWTKAIQEIVAENGEVLKMAEDEEREAELSLFLDEHVFNKPKEYFSEDKLQEGFGVIVSIRNFVLSALGKEELPTRDSQRDQWMEDMVQKYGIEPGADQERTLMSRLIFAKMTTNDELREKVVRSAQERNVSFLSEPPFNVYRPGEWLERFKEEELIEMAEDIATSKILKI
jgi:type I restriction enzyme R subunit